MGSHCSKLIMKKKSAARRKADTASLEELEKNNSV